MADRDYYEVLGITRNASADDIRKAYKKLSRQFHPDKNPGDDRAAERFKEVQEANQVLGDEETRAQYDRFGPAYRQARAAGGAPGGFPPGGMPGGFDFSSLFGGGMDLGDLFGGGASRGRRSQAQRGSDIRTTIQVPFQVAVSGGGHELSIQPEGSGGRTERLTVKIPAGIAHGEVLRLKGQGGAGQGGAAGDLLVTVHVASHPWFRRDGMNLLVDLPVTPAEAVLGARIEVPTLDDGLVLVSIPAATSSGARLRLKGKGIRHARSGEVGDQLVVVKIVVGEDLDESERALYEKLAEHESAAGESPRDGLWSGS